MCKGFNCLDCPVFNSQNCYYYGKDFMDYYKKVQLENKNRYITPYFSNLESVELNI
ncbi:MAG: hypothetical protein KGD58_12365 [Candidatus Lokiarchaeota archaeon]|nr:hypothetical protein [Candidatus Lokiarchaeota archaeon]